MNLSLFIVLLHYPDPKALLPILEAHQAWADQYSRSGVFLLAGPMSSFDGGAVLAQAASREELVEIMQEDPLYKANLETFDIHEFVPRRGLLRRSADNPLYLTEEQSEAAFGQAAESERRDSLVSSDGPAQS